MSLTRRNGWTFINDYKDKRPLGENRRVGWFGPWLFVVYKNKLFFGRCAYYGPYIGNYEWEIFKAEKVPYLDHKPSKIYEETDKPPIITAWREIPDYLPEIPVKYKIRAGTEDR